MKRVAVKEDAEKTRANKSTSFDLTSQYEVDLLNFAEEPKHGNYSVFVKQLIAERMERERRGSDHSVPVAVSVPDKTEVRTDGFL